MGAFGGEDDRYLGIIGFGGHANGPPVRGVDEGETHNLTGLAPPAGPGFPAPAVRLAGRGRGV
ncbi:hypothetical protein GCM10022254_08850 [Actinomadura meridiana]|uniref:Uncharacterized protein n=1 Tax=Actinomadura meridiana TaxID=559626 RepID=A0ABP8BTM4_9ACTN